MATLIELEGNLAHNKRVREWEIRRKAIMRQIIKIEQKATKERRAATTEELAEYRRLKAAYDADKIPQKLR